jgi:peptidoglycan/xylan/chitin deacetylase (PgdA/CDA1 family)
VVGRCIRRAPHLLERIAREGHRIGNHSHRHVRARPLGFWGYRRDLLRCQIEINSRVGAVPNLYRPPFGQLSVTTLLTARCLGLQPVTWSLDSGDWRCRTPHDIRQAANVIVSKARPRDIILMHDDKPGVLAILDRILPALSTRGLDLTRGAEWLTTCGGHSSLSWLRGKKGASGMQ